MKLVARLSKSVRFFMVHRHT